MAALPLIEEKYLLTDMLRVHGIYTAKSVHLPIQ